MAPHVYIVISGFGLQNIYLDEGDARARAQEIHENTEDPELAFRPVWVAAHSVGDDDSQWDIGMFPDHKGKDLPGFWVPAIDPDTGASVEDYPSPWLVIGGTGELPPWE